MLMVIFGAGASYDSAPRHPAGIGHGNEARPPLANELFSIRFRDVLNQFPQFRPLVPFLDVSGQDRSMEEVLQGLLAESQDDPRRHSEFLAILHYLPRVIGRCEVRWLDQHARVTNQLTLLSRIELWRRRNKERVYLVTFNYDTLIEEALAELFQLRIQTINDYVRDDAYKLIKLHGSMTWFHEVESPADFSSDIVGELIARAAELKLGPGFAIRSWEFTGRDSSNGPPMVPAIAMPVERKQTFECPTDHLATLVSALPHTTKLILVGWRGREEHFLALLRQGLRADVPAIVVGKDAADAEALVTWFRTQGVPGYFNAAALSGFTDFVRTGAAERFLAR
jgi:hypothetical protein